MKTLSRTKRSGLANQPACLKQGGISVLSINLSSSSKADKYVRIEDICEGLRQFRLCRCYQAA